MQKQNKHQSPVDLFFHEQIVCKMFATWIFTIGRSVRYTMTDKAHVDRRTKYSICAIQNALLEILEEKHLDSISVTEVCERADVNRGTFYKYYRDIYELYDMIENQFVNNLRDLLSETSEQGSDDLFMKVTMMIQSNRAFVRPRYRGEGSARLLGKLLAIVLPGMTDVVLARRPDLSNEEAHYLGEFVIGGCARMYEVWINDGMTLPANRMQQYISSFVGNSMQKH